MIYYEDNRFIIYENKDGTYNIHDAKFGGRPSYINQCQDSVDAFIQKRKEYVLANTMHDRYIYKRNVTLENNAKTNDRSMERLSHIVCLLKMEDFSNYKYPCLSKIIQLSLEYLMLEGLPDAYRSSQIPDEILEICSIELNKN